MIQLKKRSSSHSPKSSKGVKTSGSDTTDTEKKNKPRKKKSLRPKVANEGTEEGADCVCKAQNK